MNIIVDLNTSIKDGTEVVFSSPVDCSQVNGLKVYYIGLDGNSASQEFAFADAHGNNVGDIDHLFAENVVVKVILDVATSMAFVQNADTNAYLEWRFEGVSVDDSKASNRPWSSQNTVEKLCPNFTEPKGAVVTCTPVEGSPLHVVSHIDIDQPGTGDPSPDNIRTIKGYDNIKLSRTGKNLFGGDALANVIVEKGGTKDVENGTVRLRPSVTLNAILFNNFKESTQYTFIFYGSNAAVAHFNLRVRYTDNSYTEFKPSAAGVDEFVIITSAAGKTVKDLNVYYYSGDTVLHYNQCGIFEGVVTAKDFEPYVGNTFTVDIGQTTYAGSFDWSTGLLTMTWACMTATELTSMSTAGYGVIVLSKQVDVIDFDGKNPAVRSSHYKEDIWNEKYPNYHTYAPNKRSICITDRTNLTSLADAKAYFAQQTANGTPVQICYKLNTPITVQLEPQEILALAGTNTIYSSTGDTEVSGKADPTAVIEKLTNAIIALGGNI